MAAKSAAKVQYHEPVKRQYNPLMTAPRDRHVRLFVEGFLGEFDLPFPCILKGEIWMSMAHGCAIKHKAVGWLPW